MGRAIKNDVYAVRVSCHSFAVAAKTPLEALCYVAKELATIEPPEHAWAAPDDVWWYKVDEAMEGDAFCELCDTLYEVAEYEDGVLAHIVHSENECKGH